LSRGPGGGATNAIAAVRARLRSGAQCFSRSGSLPRNGMAWKSRLKVCGASPRGVWAIRAAMRRSCMRRSVRYRTERRMHERLIAALIAQTPLGDAPHTFNLDFHAIPFRGNEPDLEKHWAPLRNRALTAAMAFVAPPPGPRLR